MTIWLKPREYDQKFHARADLTDPDASIEFQCGEDKPFEKMIARVRDLPEPTMDELARFAEDLIADHFCLPRLAVYFGRVY